MNKILIIVILSYLIGSVPFGVIISIGFKGIDIRSSGSGNIGAANAFRTLGTGLGILVLITDIAKGIIAVILASQLADPNFLVLSQIIAGLTVILGHNYSIFLKFKGGKGIATSLGVFIALAWKAALIAIFVYIVMLAITRYSSAGSLTAILSMPLLVYLFKLPVEIFWFTVLIAIIAFYKHKNNLIRLFKKQETKMF